MEIHHLFEECVCDCGEDMPCQDYEHCQCDVCRQARWDIADNLQSGPPATDAELKARWNDRKQFYPLLANAKMLFCALIVLGRNSMSLALPVPTAFAGREDEVRQRYHATLRKSYGSRFVRAWTIMLLLGALIGCAMAQTSLGPTTPPPQTASQLFGALFTLARDTFYSVLGQSLDAIMQALWFVQTTFEPWVGACVDYFEQFRGLFIALGVLILIWTSMLVLLWLFFWTYKWISRAFEKVYGVMADVTFWFLMYTTPVFVMRLLMPKLYARLFYDVESTYFLSKDVLVSKVGAEGVQLSVKPSKESAIRNAEPRSVKSSADLPKSLLVFGGFLTKDSTDPYPHGMGARVSMSVAGRVVDGVLISGHQFHELRQMGRFTIASARKPQTVAVVFSSEMTFIAASVKSDVALVSLPQRVYSNLEIGQATVGRLRGTNGNVRLYTTVSITPEFSRGWAVSWTRVDAVNGTHGVGWKHYATTAPSNSGAPLYDTYNDKVLLVHVAGGPRQADGFAQYNCASSPVGLMSLASRAKPETPHGRKVVDDWEYDLDSALRMEGDAREGEYGDHWDSRYEAWDTIETSNERYSAFVTEEQDEFPERVRVAKRSVFDTPLRGPSWAEEDNNSWYDTDAIPEALNSPMGGLAPQTSSSSTATLNLSGKVEASKIIANVSVPQVSRSMDQSKPATLITKKSDPVSPRISKTKAARSTGGLVEVPPQSSLVLSSKQDDINLLRAEVLRLHGDLGRQQEKMQNDVLQLREGFSQLSQLQQDLKLLTKQKGKEKESAKKLPLSSSEKKLVPKEPVSKPAPESGSKSSTINPKEPVPSVPPALTKSAKRRLRLKSKSSLTSSGKQPVKLPSDSAVTKEKQVVSKLMAHSAKAESALQ